MTNKEKAFLSKLKKAFPKMSETEKERLLIFGEAIGMIADKREPTRVRPKTSIKSPIIRANGK